MANYLLAKDYKHFTAFTYPAIVKMAGGADQMAQFMEKSINEKYEPNFLKLYDAVWQAGKAYASKNGIQVQEVNPSPSL